MNFEQLKTFSRLFVPGAKTNRISNAALEVIINDAAVDVARNIVLLPKEDNFDAVADQKTYDLDNPDETVSRFLLIDDGGLWWNKGTVAVPDWKELFPKTLPWLNERIGDWRTRGSSDPQWYAQKHSDLIIVPAPASDLTNGFKLYFGEAPITMTSGGHFPFGFNTEIVRFKPLSYTILKFVQWKLAKALSKEQQEAKTDYYTDLDIQNTLLNKRLDISAHRKGKFQGRKYGRC